MTNRRVSEFRQRHRNGRPCSVKIRATALFVILTVLGSGRAVRAQAAEIAPTSKPAAQPGDMKRVVDTLSLSRAEGPEKRTIKLRDQPLLRFSDPVRNVNDAALWAWGETGRPMAIVAIEIYPPSVGVTERSPCAFEFISLAPEAAHFQREFSLKLEVTKRHQVLNAGFTWEPEKPGIEFSEIAGAPSPDQMPRQRLAQLRDLSKRFAITEHASAQPDLLRLMPRPIDRYADPAHELVDGAIFLFAHGTNPEAMVLIEAQGSSVEKAIWRFAVARLTVAPFEVTLDRRAVRTVAYHSDSLNRPSSPYFTTRVEDK
jgi:hypothetical protein